MPERVVMYEDGPWCEADIPALLSKDDVWWAAQGNFDKLTIDRFRRTGLLSCKYLNFWPRVSIKLFFMIDIKWTGFFVFSLPILTVYF